MKEKERKIHLLMMDSALRNSLEERDSFDVEEDLELNEVEENMSMLSLTNRITSSTDDISVDLTGFFSDDDDDYGHEELSYGNMTDDAEEGVGDKLECFKSGSDSNEVVSNASRLLRRRNLNGSRKKSSNACNALGASVISGYNYKSPLSDLNKPLSKPIDIVYGDADQCRDFSQFKKSRSRRSLYRSSREDWREKAWERKRDQALSEELSCDNNYFSDFQSSKTASDSASEEARADSPYSTLRRTSSTPRVRKLTNVDLDELKGCLDLGFGFNYEEMPELSNTLPALELCYAIGQQFQDDHHQKSSPVSTLDNMDSPNNEGYAQSPIANWKISSPGDHPQEVKERLKVWAQAVACTVRLCS